MWNLRNPINQDVYKKDWQWQEGEYTVTRTCQWSGPGCHQGCSVLFYTKDNKLIKVEGDPNSNINNGRLCMRCFAVPEATYHPTRIIHPQKRVGERGENKWEQITWDEAYDIIESKVRKIWEEYTPKSIVTCFGTGRNATWQSPVLSLVGYKSPNIGGGFLSGDSCYAPRLMAMHTFLGGSFIADLGQLFEQQYDHPEWEPPKYIVLWGCNPIMSNSDGFFGHWVVDAMKLGSKLITVDPRLTWLAAKSEVWLQIRPGTDCAVAMGILNYMINEGVYDREFVDKWCYGFEELKEAVKDMTPARAAEIAWTSEEKIIDIAKKLGTTKPWAMQWGVPIDQAKHGVATSQAIVSIMALSGNIDIPGSSVLVDTGYIQSDVRAAMMHNVSPDISKDRFGDEFPIRKYGFINQHMTDSMLAAIETGKPYPVRMLHIMSTNTFANMGAEAKRVYDAMKSVDFIVVADLFMTPTAVACADIFLPVAMSPERWGLRGWWNPLRTITKVIDGGDVKSDEEIALDLVKRLNPEDAPWADVPELLNYVLTDLQSATYKGTFDELKKLGPSGYYTEVHYRKYENGLLRPDGQPGFNTPTGRIELKATMFEDFDLPAVTYWAEPTESPVSTPELMKDYPFVLTTGQRCYEFFHSEHRQLESMREFHPDPITEINPEDAAALGIKDGDWVYLENKHGKAKLKARLHPGMLKGVVNAEHGWWFPEREAAEPSLYGVFESNANCLTTQFDYGPTSYGAPYKNQICKVYKA
ncbi:molydopterin dinucleotide-binding region [Desulfitobacterium hafniense DCB-2]|uniref:Molybdopterin oxidoreductase, acetylene hydratase-like n=2 Tax=Desulfitobacterium hafniense TaxID=49338 RepID=A0A098B4D4_DESHA|nr:molybdopterin-dependent oxidoreductase [Desulfitobacterium hafniense]ACL19945.1 molydopterin dinucleotide-binding region [Desulfitobacterium hafniense DCB-2]CDX03699.1 Molybdopterin oxidoreductase, acetylene hydratase-like [Desulfitobacterium hafniense]